MRRRPLCPASCPVEAISFSRGKGDKRGTVVIDHSVCIRCGRCVGACPFGAMSFDKDKRTPHKCQLRGDEDPACAIIRPTGSIVFVRRKAFHSQSSSLQMKAFTLLRERNKKSIALPKQAPGADPAEQAT